MSDVKEISDRVETIESLKEWAPFMSQRIPIFHNISERLSDVRTNVCLEPFESTKDIYLTWRIYGVLYWIEGQELFGSKKSGASSSGEQARKQSTVLR
jgi:hypothetical protein